MRALRNCPKCGEVMVLDYADRTTWTCLMGLPNLGCGYTGTAKEIALAMEVRRGEERMAMIRKRDIQMRDFGSLDDLVIAVVELATLADGYAKLNVEVPDWLTAKLREGRAELDVRLRIQKERKLAEMKIRREGIATPDEKRAKLDKEIADLEVDLK